ncbi:MAG TPA: LysM peptidoglycan-binding domain-containing protein [Pyrinomonadaceae bacterium]|nr:LysM peptidoglycan-binding domain-containing protein [Pyrinomonadaceae bacterium]
MTYTVKAGDTLSMIASRNGLTLAQLLQANPQISDPNKVQAGAVLTLPNSSSSNESTRPLPPNPVELAVTPDPLITSTDNTRPLPSNPVPAVSAGVLGEALAEALGTLSAKYETGGRGPGTVSTGAGDPGGVSYGSYQMATKMGTVARFVGQPGFKWAKDFQGLAPGTAQFTAVWKRIAAEQTAKFQNAQHSYIKQTHYDFLAAKVLSEDAVDVNTRSRALQDVIWSTAVQHGGATPIVHRAIASLTCDCSDPAYDKQLICAIYAERGRKKPEGNLAYFSKSAPGVQAGVSKRFKNEEQDALAMLARET